MYIFCYTGFHENMKNTGFHENMKNTENLFEQERKNV